MTREIKFRAWDGKEMNYSDDMPELGVVDHGNSRLAYFFACYNNYNLMQCTGLKDKNGKEIYEGDIVGEEGVYHFIEREGWKPSSGKWKIIGEKSKNFTGIKEEKYIAGYELKTVIWEDSSCGFEPFSDSEANCGHCGGQDYPQKKVVIGNIYENPELLTHTS